MVKAPDGPCHLDFGGKARRGAYVCHDVECLRKARKSKALERAFDTVIRRRVRRHGGRTARCGWTGNILSLLGLSLRGGRLAVGEEPVEAVARAGTPGCCCWPPTRRRAPAAGAKHFAQAGDCLWLQLPFTKAELGRALGRTAVAIAAVTDMGLAATLSTGWRSWIRAQYADAADRMDLKAAGPRSAGRSRRPMRGISAGASAGPRRRLTKGGQTSGRKCHRACAREEPSPAAQSHTDPVPPGTLAPSRRHRRGHTPTAAR